MTEIAIPQTIPEAIPEEIPQTIPEEIPDKITDDELVRLMSNNHTEIIPLEQLNQNKATKWGRNGLGDRWMKSQYNYSVIYSNYTTRLYSEIGDQTIPAKLLEDFKEKIKPTKRVQGIIGIYVHSKKQTKNENKPTRRDIGQIIRNKSCVVCGTTETVCDHKNDLYNDSRVLNIETQQESDFQPLCNHCNLQKRTVSRKEHKLQKIYSAKRISQYQVYPFEFPWEKKAYDPTDKFCKHDTYWFDPVEFNRKIFCYSSYVWPIVNKIKQMNEHKKI